MSSDLTYNEPVADASMVGCPHCDLLQRLPTLADGASARCPRCAGELWRQRKDSLDRTLTMAVTAAMLYVLGMQFPCSVLRSLGVRPRRR
jgi:paraquat-inducible protein A